MSEPLVLGTTALGEGFLCKAKFNYHQNEHLVLRPRQVSYPVRRGIWVHTCLEHLHRGLDWEEALDILVGWAHEQQVDDAQVATLQEEVRRLVEDYQAFYRKEPPWTVLRVEASLPVQLTTDLIATPTIDLLVEEEGHRYLVELKTTTAIPDATWRAIDPQTALQQLAVEAHDGPVRGIIFDYVNTSPPSIPRATKGDKNATPAFYANTAQTTSRSFGKGVEALKLAYDTYYKGNGWESEPARIREFNEYVAGARVRLVQDDKFFQRVRSYRSPEQLQATLLDTVVLGQELRVCQQLGHWPHNFGLHCRLPRPCFYSEVCATEYIHGRRADATRADLYMLDDGSREGRIEVTSRGRRLSIRDGNEEHEGGPF